MKHIGLVWFRRDLRLTDNPALEAALERCDRVIPIYIHAPQEEGDWAPGAASRWWLHHSLEALDASLRERGSRLTILEGESLATLQHLVERTGATHLFWNRLYEPALTERDSKIKQQLQGHGLTVESFNAALLFEPWQVLKDNGEPYRVFTPYWKALQRRGLPQIPLPAPKSIGTTNSELQSLTVDALNLLPVPRWDSGLHSRWEPGERGAWQRLELFIDDRLLSYIDERDIPAAEASSTLSPHLHFGEISPRQIVAAVEQLSIGNASTGLIGNAEAFLRELAWREFAHYLLFHFPHTQAQPFNPRFEHFTWAPPEPKRLQAWQRGRTGIPIVDAGMRELWHTGFMHNRVRMIAASLLSKNLLYPWQEGARWFWDTLVDADLAGNTLGWQWVAGCGADAAPFFRIFNPVLQGQKFDPQGRYVRRWLPEIGALPDRYIHHPWQAPAEVLHQAGITIGRHYPAPIVDLKLSRTRALERHAELKHLN